MRFLIVLLTACLLVCPAYAETYFTSVAVGGGYGATGTTLDSEGNISLDGDLVADGELVLSGDLDVGGYVTAGGGYGDTGTTLAANGDVSMNGDLVVDGELVLSGGLDMEGDLDVDGDVTAGGGYGDTGTTLAANGDVSMNGDLVVDGGYLEINNAPNLTPGLQLTGSSWTTASIESTGTGADPIIELKAKTGTWLIRNDESEGNKLTFENGTWAMHLFSPAAGGGMYLYGNCSANSFTDRSPVYKGDEALKLLGDVKAVVGTKDADGWAEVDHSTLGRMRKDNAKKEAEEDAEPGRDLGMNIQLNSAAILELLKRVERLEARKG